LIFEPSDQYDRKVCHAFSSRYILPFTWHAVNGAILGEMKEADLIVLGVSDVEQRRKLLRLFDLYPDDHSSGSRFLPLLFLDLEET